jgi:hypothetical protein
MAEYQGRGGKSRATGARRIRQQFATGRREVCLPAD